MSAGDDKTKERLDRENYRSTMTCSTIYSSMFVIAVMASAGILMTFVSFNQLESYVAPVEFTGDSDGYLLTAFILSCFAFVALLVAFVLLMYLIDFALSAASVKQAPRRQTLKNYYTASFVATLVSAIATAVALILIGVKKWSVGVTVVDDEYSLIQFILAAIFIAMVLGGILPHYYLRKYGLKLHASAFPSSVSAKESTSKARNNKGFSKIKNDA